MVRSGGGGERSLALPLSQTAALSHQMRKKMTRIQTSLQPGSSLAAVLSRVGEMTQLPSQMTVKVQLPFDK